ncbi:MAG: DUF480 domain-containing protein [Planctomycetaceae bacterium]
MDHDAPQNSEIRELSFRQRRVLGVLLEKGLTTPEYYPMTMKAVIAGCNQKSNRSPVTNYDEDAVEETLDQLRELGLSAVILPDSGRTERYRHYVRKRYAFSEPQIAILTELLLRGRQTLGELRSRAGRMVVIEDLATLRSELNGLLEQGYVQSSDALERRGVEVDHCFYRPDENRTLTGTGRNTATDSGPPPDREVSSASIPEQPSGTLVSESTLADLRAENRELRSTLEELTQKLQHLNDRVDELCRDLGA